MESESSLLSYHHLVCELNEVEICTQFMPDHVKNYNNNVHAEGSVLG